MGSVKEDPLHFKNAVTAPSPLFSKYDPLPNSASVVKGKNYRFTVLDAGCIRFEYSPDGSFEDRASTFAVHRNVPKVDYTLVDDRRGGLEIKTSRMHLIYTGGEFTASTLKCDCEAKLGQDWVQSWRYGIKSKTLGGTMRTLDGVDGRGELEEGILSPNSITVIDDSETMLFTSDGWIAPREKGRIDGYLFGYGPEYREALRVFYEISGKPPLIPRWAFGNWYSRYYPYSAEEYLKLMDKFKEQDIPLSVAVLDMDWHKIDIPAEYGTPWTGYSWEKKLFPDPPGFLQQLHDRNLKATPNTHPADGVRGFEDAYPAMCKALGRDTEGEYPVNFDCTDRSFMSAYFSTLSHPLEDEGLDFWWLDWQQGRYSRIPGVDPLWVLNHYHFLDSVRKGRPMTFSRYAGPGSGRYPIGFSGDSHITWDSLHFQPEFTATAANIGFGYWSNDIGGHFGGVKDDELMTRWVQQGVFSPIFRLHSSNNPFNSRMPWSFNAESQKVISTFMRLRAQLVPYIYSESVKCAKEGRAIIEPMYYDYPEDQESFYNKNQHTFGTQAIVSPITTPRNKETTLGKVDTWIPAGKWVDVFTHTIYDGDRTIPLHRPLNQFPVLLKQGSMIPLENRYKLENGCPLPTNLELIVIVGKDGEYELCEDDGTSQSLEETKFSKTKIQLKQSEGKLIIHPTNDSLVKQREWSIRLVGFATKGDIVAEGDGKKLDIQVKPKAGRTIVQLPSLSPSTAITINLGKDPQLGQNDVDTSVQDLLEKLQISYEQKWSVAKLLKVDSKPMVKIGRLEALKLSKEVESAIKELLFAQIQ